MLSSGGWQRQQTHGVPGGPVRSFQNLESLQQGHSSGGAFRCCHGIASSCGDKGGFLGSGCTQSGTVASVPLRPSGADSAANMRTSSARCSRMPARSSSVSKSAGATRRREPSAVRVNPAALSSASREDAAKGEGWLELFIIFPFIVGAGCAFIGRGGGFRQSGIWKICAFICSKCARALSPAPPRPV